MKIMDKEQFQQANIFGTGAPNTGFAQYFKGQSFLHPLTDSPDCPLPLFNVTFEPGCRNNWHIHHAKQGGDQMLICTAGEGWYQEWGKPAVELSWGRSSPSPPGSSTGTGPRRTPGSATLPLRSPAKRAPTSGVSR